MVGWRFRSLVWVSSSQKTTMNRSFRNCIERIQKTTPLYQINIHFIHTRFMNYKLNLKDMIISFDLLIDNKLYIWYNRIVFCVCIFRYIFPYKSNIVQRLFIYCFEIVCGNHECTYYIRNLFIIRDSSTKNLKINLKIIYLITNLIKVQLTSLKIFISLFSRHWIINIRIQLSIPPITQ